MTNRKLLREGGGRVQPERHKLPNGTAGDHPG